MFTRRHFIKQSALLSAGFFINKKDWFKEQKAVGLQLYTLRQEMGKDPKGTLAKVAAQGYKEMETFGYNNGKWFGLTATELKETLTANGLRSPSGHTFPGGFFLRSGWEDNWKKAMEDSKTLGQEYIVIPWLEPQHRNNIDNYKIIAEGLNKAGEMCRQHSLQLAYHNHDFEFNAIDGQTGLDILLGNTDAKLVQFEMDIYWISKAGHDPVALFKQNKGRFSLWHVKDMDNTDKKFFTEVGNGVINYKEIFKHAGESGMKYFFVEQDVCPGPPLESTAKSITYLKNNILK